VHGEAGTEDPKAGPDPHQKPNETPQKGPKAKARNRPRSAGIGETRFQFFTKTRSAQYCERWR